MSATPRCSLPRSIRAFVAIGTLLGLAACNPSTLAANTTAVNSKLETAELEASKVITFYGVAKGLETIACPASVTTQTCVDARLVVAKLDPIVVQVQTQMASATADATVIEGLVASINSEAVTLENQVAPAVSVVKNAV